MWRLAPASENQNRSGAEEALGLATESKENPLVVRFFLPRRRGDAIVE